jgi:hypothetical protein
MRRADEEAQAHAQGAADRLPGDSSGAASQWPPHPHSPQPGGAAFVLLIASTERRCAASRFVHSSRAILLLSSLPPCCPDQGHGPLDVGIMWSSADGRGNRERGGEGGGGREGEREREREREKIRFF